MPKAKKKHKPNAFTAREAAAVIAHVLKGVRPSEQVAIGIDPGMRGLGIVVCHAHTGRLKIAEAFPLPKGKEATFTALQKLLALPHPAVKFIAIEAQPGIARRQVVRVEAWCYAIAHTLGAEAIYIQPRRKGEAFILDANDQKKIDKLSKDLREHAASALFFVRKALKKKNEKEATQA